MFAGRLGRTLFQVGVALAVLGGGGAILDALFAGCIASGPCQPVSPVPLWIPLLLCFVGVALVVVTWKKPAVAK